MGGRTKVQGKKPNPFNELLSRLILRAQVVPTEGLYGRLITWILHPVKYIAKRK
jgi:hypothetical protein